MSPLILKLILLAIISGQLIKLPIGRGGGATLLDLVVILLVVFGLVKNKFKLPKSGRLIKSSFPFILVALISFLFSPLNLNISERFTAFLYLIRFSSYILLGWLLPTLVPDKINIRKLLTLSGVILAVFGLLQFIFIPDLGFLAKDGWDPHYFRTASTFLDPNFLGAYLVLTLLLLVWSFQPSTERITILSTTTVYLALLTTFSRGAYLAFLVAFLTFSFLKKSLRLAFLTLGLFAILMISFFAYQKAVASPKGIDRVQSAEARLDTWQQGTKMFLGHPILGVGFNTYRFALKEYQLADEGFIGSHGASSNDSSLLFVLSTTGIIGFTAYLYWLYHITILSYRKNPVLLAGLVGLLTQSFFANTLFYPFILLWLVLLCYDLGHE